MGGTRKALGRHMRPTPGTVSTELWDLGHAGETVRRGLGVSWTGVSKADPEPRTPTPLPRRQSTIGSTAPSLPASSGSKGMVTTLQKIQSVFDEKAGKRGLHSPELVLLRLDMY